jgi:hypothetical protein
MSWNEIIAQIDAEIARLERARDLLAGAPTIRNTALRLPTTKKTAARKTAPRPPSARKTAAAKKRTQPKTQLTIPFLSETPSPEIAAASTAPAPEKETTQPIPQVKVLPPKRRFERRPSQRRAASEKTGKHGAALAGAVPSGPVVVSADEARKAQERNANAPSTETPVPASVEAPPSASSERSLGSLIQAFERSNRLNRLGTP